MVDIFEAGPILSCEVEQIRIVRESQEAELEEVTAGETESPRHIIATTGMDFRAAAGTVEPGQSGVRIAAEVAEALRLKPGDRLIYAEARPSKAVTTAGHQKG